MRGRAFRRHQYERMKARAARVMRVIWFHGKDMAEDPRHCGIHANTFTRCSCVGCGNPRRHFKEPTIQERRAKL